MGGSDKVQKPAYIIFECSLSLIKILLIYGRCFKNKPIQICIEEFWSALIPMIICVSFNIVIAIEVTFVKDSKLISTPMKVVNMIFSPIWPIYTLFLTSITIFKNKIYLKDSKKTTDERKRLSIISNNAHLIEVITESSLQPLVQVFSIYLRLAYSDSDVNIVSTEIKGAFDALLAKDWSELGELLETSKTSLQFWSFLTSVASVAWSFQSNYARKKFGQMSIFSRVIYLFYVLFAVNARITIIIGFLLAINSDPRLNSPFTQIYVVIGSHMCLCMLIDLWLNFNKYTGENRHCFWKIRDCLLKAFSTIYIYHPTDDSENEDIRSHLSIDMLILLETIVFTGVISSKSPNSGLLLGIVWAAYLTSLILKVIFYVTLHPWAEVLKSDITSWKWKKSQNEPQVELVKGPRKLKCMAIYDRVVEGTLYEWTICNDGRVESEEEKSKYVHNKSSNFFKKRNAWTVKIGERSGPR